MTNINHPKATHGMSDSPEHSSWGAMLNRTRRKSAKYYGARGITVCPQWQGRDGFLTFYRDMGPRPSMKHSIDRIDNDGNYEPGNCRWATRLEQNHNRSLTKKVMYRGREIALAEAVSLAGGVVTYIAAWMRIERLGWSVEDAVETPRRRLSSFVHYRSNRIPVTCIGSRRDR